MKDAYIYDGSGWQSLKGPPGPSAVSADAGNRLTLGSDGLLYAAQGLTDTDRYVFCRRGDNPQERYAYAVGLANNVMEDPFGNLITLVILPGHYDGGLVVDDPRVNVFALGQSRGRASAWFDTVAVSTANCRVSGVGSKNEFATTCVEIAGLPPFTIVNCEGGEYSFAGGGTYIDCRGGVGAFGGSGMADGVYIDCEGGDASFGGYGVANGYFLRCRGGDQSFGGYGLASGVFNQCIGGQGAFGCQGDDGAFGLFHHCSVTSGPGFGYGSNCTGEFLYCSGGDGSFGFDGSMDGARIMFCSIRDGVFPPAGPNSFIRYCVNGDGSEANSP